MYSCTSGEPVPQIWTGVYVEGLFFRSLRWLERGDSMSRRPRRNHTAEFKSKVALAAIRGEKTLSELAEQFDIHPNQITQWKSQLLEGAASVFGGEAKAEPAAAAVDVKTLHAKIGALTLENDFLEGALTKAGLLSARR
jgi:transposase